jgi:hypothetical protein
MFEKSERTIRRPSGLDREVGERPDRVVEYRQVGPLSCQPTCLCNGRFARDDRLLAEDDVVAGASTSGRYTILDVCDEAGDVLVHEVPSIAEAQDADSRHSAATTSPISLRDVEPLALSRPDGRQMREIDFSVQ